MKLAARISALEARLPEPDLEPASYAEYIDLCKQICSNDHPMIGPLRLPSGRFNPDMYCNVPAPEHCLSRDDYESLTWDNAAQCYEWIIDRCERSGKYNDFMAFLSRSNYGL